MQRFDKATLVVTILAMIGWTAAPDYSATGAGLSLVMLGAMIIAAGRALSVQLWQQYSVIAGMFGV